MITEANPADAAAVELTCLFEKYHGEIFGYLARLTGDRQTAEDLLQETFLRALRARKPLSAIENPRAWLYRIATNLALNAVKRRNRFSFLPWSAAKSHGESDPGEQVTTRSAVEQALDSLSPDNRAALLLSAHFGFSIDELAEALGASPGAVKVRLCRARELFRQAYERAGGTRP